MIKAITESSKIANGEKKAVKASEWLKTNPEFWSMYQESVLYAEQNYILELTVGAGGGTNAVISKMGANDYYMGVDIDFVCAKNADAIAHYYGVNGLGIATSLWNLPFDNEMFTTVCSNAGLEECREIPTVLSEAYRVLASKGRLVLHCIKQEKSFWYSYFKKYGFSMSEATEWLKHVRLYASIEQVKEILFGMGAKLLKQIDNEGLGHILVFEKSNTERQQL